MDASLLAFLGLAIAGSLHCAGMCGGFAAAVALRRGAVGRRLALDQLAFVAGKAATYVVLGMVVRTLLDETLRAIGIAELQRVLSVLVGVVLVLGGIKLAGWSRGRSSAKPSRLAGWLGSLSSLARSEPGAAGAFGAGLVTGLLPCGLSWSAFALATQVDPATALIGLALFGLGTGPALALVALGGVRLSTWSLGTRRIGARLAGVTLIAFGLLTAWRGGWTLDDALDGSAAPCCEAAGAVHEHE